MIKRHQSSDWSTPGKKQMANSWRSPRRRRAAGMSELPPPNSASRTYMPWDGPAPQRGRKMPPTGDWFNRKAGNPRQSPLQLECDQGLAVDCSCLSLNQDAGAWPPRSAESFLIPGSCRCRNWLMTCGCQIPRFLSDHETSLCRTLNTTASAGARMPKAGFASMTHFGKCCPWETARQGTPQTFTDCFPWAKGLAGIQARRLHIKLEMPRASPLCPAHPSTYHHPLAAS